MSWILACCLSMVSLCRVYAQFLGSTAQSVPFSGIAPMAAWQKSSCSKSAAIGRGDVCAVSGDWKCQCKGDGTHCCAAGFLDWKCCPHGYDCCRPGGQSANGCCLSGKLCDNVDKYCVSQEDFNQISQWGRDGDCRFYTGYDAVKNCGKDDYLTKYGYKYCRRFYKTLPYFDAAGRKWISCVRRKLTNFLLPKWQQFWGSCPEILRLAFNSHSRIYTSCGFCQICRTNKFALLRTYDLKDFLSVQALKQIFDTVKKCGFRCL